MAVHVDYDSFMIFNPEGKVKQLEFIRNTIELGNTVLGLRNGRYGVIIAHNEKVAKLANPQKKIFQINKKTLFTFSGITNDGLNIVKHLIDVSMSEEIIKDRDIHYLDVFNDFAFEASFRTLGGGTRLLGVAGILMTDYDGIKLVLMEPQGSVKEVRAMSIGNRSQSCRTILESECMSFEDMDLEGLIKVGIKAIQNAHPESGVLNGDNVEIMVLETGGNIYPVDSASYLN